MAPKPIRKEAGTVGVPSIVVKAANPLRIKSVNGVFALTFTVKAHRRFLGQVESEVVKRK